MVHIHDENDNREIVEDGEETAIHDDLELSDEEELSTAKLKSLRQKLKQTEEEKLKCLEDLQRARADFLNSKRRLEEQVAKDKERATDKILIELLTLADSFDIATQDKEWQIVEGKWKSGVEAIQAKLISILKSNNVVPVDPTGCAFNPEEHEAVSNSIVDDESKVDTVVTVLQKGYKRNNDVVRPARVVVGVK